MNHCNHFLCMSRIMLLCTIQFSAFKSNWIILLDQHTTSIIIWIIWYFNSKGKSELWSIRYFNSKGKSELWSIQKQWHSSMHWTPFHLNLIKSPSRSSSTNLLERLVLNIRQWISDRNLPNQKNDINSFTLLRANHSIIACAFFGIMRTYFSLTNCLRNFSSQLANSHLSILTSSCNSLNLSSIFLIKWNKCSSITPIIFINRSRIKKLWGMKTEILSLLLPRRVEFLPFHTTPSSPYVIINP